MTEIKFYIPQLPMTCREYIFLRDVYQYAAELRFEQSLKAHHPAQPYPDWQGQRNDAGYPVDPNDLIKSSAAAIPQAHRRILGQNVSRPDQDLIDNFGALVDNLALHTILSREDALAYIYRCAASGMTTQQIISDVEAMVLRGNEITMTMRISVDASDLSTRLADLQATIDEARILGKKEVQRQLNQPLTYSPIVTDEEQSELEEKFVHDQEDALKQIFWNG